MHTPYLQFGHSSVMGFSSWVLQKSADCIVLPVLASAYIPHLIFPYLAKGDGSTLSYIILNGHISGFGRQLVSLARL